MKELIQALIESQDYVEIFGFYSRQYSISLLQYVAYKLFIRLRAIICLRFPFSGIVLLRWRD